jgi:hypothetical protein
MRYRSRRTADAESAQLPRIEKRGDPRNSGPGRLDLPGQQPVDDGGSGAIWNMKKLDNRAGGENRHRQIVNRI